MDHSNKPHEAEDSRTGSSDTPGPANAREGKPAKSAISSEVPVCDLCGTIMVERHCRLICMQCGYQRDCSDP